MAFQIVLNVFIAFIWVLLQNSFTFGDFVIGYVIGFGVLYLLQKILPFEFYFRRLKAVFALLWLFTKELFIANIDMVKIVLSPSFKHKPGIIAVPTNLTKKWEISLISCLISLTPGTLVMDYSLDSKYIYIHNIDIESRKAMIEDIQNKFEKAILEVRK
ncbi:multisubunit sodium/proton antiporter MrpE subunit [Sinobaca qinghaiensis]|uniref:Multisubunit sodium/proton antiporter MrpE subunit n=1 Tax=Sinobaca qinghaiensis TaxID=342944 RepID=A0A419V3G3_9BACL|nr:Na+/H+ antiporter subunit E [Sinobaca qinghaiensis]RKD73065.1 multisubunit sodium/proton antiporter MrpE subunit [Sinobaca qinghaiensis]